MKQLIIISITLVLWVAGFSQETRDHRKPKPENAITTIDFNKWYYIKQAGTEKYMHISGHKDQRRSMAYLAVENLQPDNISQQWRFVITEKPGYYRLENRKYRGYLCPTSDNFYLETRGRNDDAHRSVKYFTLLKYGNSWCILTFYFGIARALSTVTRFTSHCEPYAGKPLIGGRVLAECECGNRMRREYVTTKNNFTDSDQKWILEEAREW